MKKQCPYCGSLSYVCVRIYRQGYSFFYTLLGRILFGKYGALWGIDRRKHSQWYCRSCGRSVYY